MLCVAVMNHNIMLELYTYQGNIFVEKKNSWSVHCTIGFNANNLEGQCLIEPVTTTKISPSNKSGIRVLR